MLSPTMAFKCAAVVFATMRLVTAHDLAPAIVRARGSAATHTVAVGQYGNQFVPDSIIASPGDIIQFEFYCECHNVIQSLFGWPCVPKSSVYPSEPAFFSGYLNGTSSSGLPTWSLLVNDTSPIFFYSGSPNACAESGMIGVINAACDSSLSTQISIAEAESYALTPDEPLCAESSSSLASLAVHATCPPPGATLTSSSDTATTTDGSGSGTASGAVPPGAVVSSTGSVPASTGVSQTGSGSGTTTTAPPLVGAPISSPSSGSRLTGSARENHHLSSGAIAGIAVGSIAGVGILAALLVFCLCFARKRKASGNGGDAEGQMASSYSPGGGPAPVVGPAMAEVSHGGSMGGGYVGAGGYGGGAAEGEGENPFRTPSTSDRGGNGEEGEHGEGSESGVEVGVGEAVGVASIMQRHGNHSVGTRTEAANREDNASRQAGSSGERNEFVGMRTEGTNYENTSARNADSSRQENQFVGTQTGTANHKTGIARVAGLFGQGNQSAQTQSQTDSGSDVARDTSSFGQSNKSTRTQTQTTNSGSEVARDSSPLGQGNQSTHTRSQTTNSGSEVARDASSFGQVNQSTHTQTQTTNSGSEVAREAGSFGQGNRSTHTQSQTMNSGQEITREAGSFGKGNQIAHTPSQTTNSGSEIARDASSFGQGSQFVDTRTQTTNSGSAATTDTGSSRQPTPFFGMRIRGANQRSQTSRVASLFRPKDQSVDTRVRTRKLGNETTRGAGSSSERGQFAYSQTGGRNLQRTNTRDTDSFTERRQLADMPTEERNFENGLTRDSASFRERNHSIDTRTETSSINGQGLLVPMKGYRLGSEHEDGGFAYLPERAADSSCEASLNEEEGVIMPEEDYDAVRSSWARSAHWESPETPRPYEIERYISAPIGRSMSPRDTEWESQMRHQQHSHQHHAHHHHISGHGTGHVEGSSSRELTDEDFVGRSTSFDMIGEEHVDEHGTLHEGDGVCSCGFEAWASTENLARKTTREDSYAATEPDRVEFHDSVEYIDNANAIAFDDAALAGTTAATYELDASNSQRQTDGSTDTVNVTYLDRTPLRVLSEGGQTETRTFPSSAPGFAETSNVVGSEDQMSGNRAIISGDRVTTSRGEVVPSEGWTMTSSDRMMALGGQTATSEGRIVTFEDQHDTSDDQMAGSEAQSTTYIQSPRLRFAGMRSSEISSSRLTTFSEGSSDEAQSFSYGPTPGLETSDSRFSGASEFMFSETDSLKTPVSVRQSRSFMQYFDPSGSPSGDALSSHGFGKRFSQAMSTESQGSSQVKSEQNFSVVRKEAPEVVLRDGEWTTSETQWTTRDASP